MRNVWVAEALRKYKPWEIAIKFTLSQIYIKPCDLLRPVAYKHYSFTENREWLNSYKYLPIRLAFTLSDLNNRNVLWIRSLGLILINTGRPIHTLFPTPALQLLRQPNGV